LQAHFKERFNQLDKVQAETRHAKATVRKGIMEKGGPTQKKRSVGGEVSSALRKGKGVGGSKAVLNTGVTTKFVARFRNVGQKKRANG